MKILGIDTSTKFLCLGLLDGLKLYEYNLEVGLRLSSLLTLSIKRVLDALSLKPQDIDYFACGLGPGSFTGLRVGLAAIKGLSWPLNKPIAGILSLDILAKNAPNIDGFVVPIIDAKRELIYGSVYKNRDNQLKRITAAMLLSPKDFLNKIQQKIPRQSNIAVLGDGVGLYKEKIFSQLKGATILDKDYWYPQARNIILLAKERIKAKRCDDCFKIKPVYLYPKECQIRK